MSIEETFRDWHSGWGVRTAVVDLPTEAMVARLMGVVCLTYGLQMHLGQRRSPDSVAQQRRSPWTGTDRVRWCWCGSRLFDNSSYEWSGWLAQQGEHLEWPVATAPATPVPESA